MMVHVVAYFGFTASGSSDDGRERHVTTAISPTYAAQILQLQERGATEEAAYAGGWPEVLDRAHRFFAARLAEAGGEGETLNSVTTMLGMAAEYAEAGDLYQATVPLAYCETTAQSL
jgi:hypothetical protein